MAKKQFKAESKKLLDMMINSIYTNPEIFLRELISNASDAIDKLYYQSLTDKDIKVKKDKLEIWVIPNKEERTITIKDNGIGMDKEELEENLGTIAKSGSELFKENNEMKKDISIIGQFGVGFYSAFMVAKKVVVNSKKVLDAFIENSVCESDFNSATGYGYNDIGRDKIERVYASIFKTEDALVRSQFISGTHAISTCLFALLRPGDTLLSISGKPYDTLDSVIGFNNNSSSLKAFNIGISVLSIILFSNLP